MKIKKQVKDWRKLPKREKREILVYCESYGQKYKNHMLALKFAKKAMCHIKKDTEADCGFGANSIADIGARLVLRLGGVRTISRFVRLKSRRHLS